MGCRDVRLLILEHGRWSMIDKYQTLMKGLSIEALSAFVSAFKSQLFVEGLVQGNFTSRVSAALAAGARSGASDGLQHTELGCHLLLPLLWQSGVLWVLGSCTSNTSGVLMRISQWQATAASLNRSFQEFGFKLQIGKNVLDACNLVLLLLPFFILFGVLIYLIRRNSHSGATGGGFPQSTFILGV